ncbi:hypothetical protein F4680DRAFT_447679 [Xylaria scruposa]|nr:hypothetical protein F4680DRAFT_447679 [Xylaria scruposa]
MEADESKEGQPTCPPARAQIPTLAIWAVLISSPTLIYAMSSGFKCRHVLFDSPWLVTPSLEVLNTGKDNSYRGQPSIYYLRYHHPTTIPICSRNSTPESLASGESTYFTITTSSFFYPGHIVFVRASNGNGSFSTRP